MIQVLAAAVKAEDGRVWVGRLHSAILRVMAEAGYKLPVSARGEQGFVTDAGEFVGRAEAMALARPAGQVRKGLRGARRRELFAEDVARWGGEVRNELQVQV